MVKYPKVNSLCGNSTQSSYKVVFDLQTSDLSASRTYSIPSKQTIE